ncbi:MAG: NosD domain-containing protein [Candidatus Hodarchaeota archaeon]
MRDPITITNDDELAAVANSGTGTANDPYIIADWNITDSTTHGISITGTTKHFRVENCWIESSVEYGSCGIYVNNVSAGTTTIINNTCNNNIYGIFLWDSGSSTVTNNTCNNNDGCGIAVSSSGSSTVTNNTCNSNTGSGIFLDRSGFSIVANNTFFNDGLQVRLYSKEELFSYTVENNTVNGLPLGYFANVTDSTISKTYGQLILVNCNNTIVKNQYYSNTYIGIALYFCDENQLVNNTCNNNIYGIYLGGSGSSTVTNNTCNNNDGCGIAVSSSGSSMVTNNTCTNNDRNGICLDHSGSSTVTNNTCNSNYGSGICLDHSGSLTVTNNTCNSNTGAGISLFGCDSITVINNICSNNNRNSIGLGGSDSSTVANNICNNNSYYGIEIFYARNNSIVGNTLVGNGVYGIELSDDSANNVIHHNDFIANGQNTSQACDNGMNNQWYDETVLEGNYWSDYSGNGSYLIAGSAGASDPYPSLSPYRYTSSSSSPAFPQDVLVRIGLFLVVIGFLVVVLFVNKRKISS